VDVNAARLSGVFFFGTSHDAEIKKVRADSTKNIWSPIGRTTYDSRLSHRTGTQPLDIELRRVHRASRNRIARVVNRVSQGTV
jgi:hypothetical protein